MKEVRPAHHIHLRHFSGICSALFLLTLFLAAQPRAGAADATTWNWGAVGDWFNPSNWSSGMPGLDTTSTDLGSGTASITGSTALTGTSDGKCFGLEGTLLISEAGVLDSGNLHIEGGGVVQVYDTSAISLSHYCNLAEYGLGSLSLYGSATLVVGTYFQQNSGGTLTLDIASWVGSASAPITAQSLSLSGTLNLLSFDALAPRQALTLISNATAILPNNNNLWTAVEIDGSPQALTQVEGNLYEFEYNGDTFLLNYSGGLDGSDVVLTNLSPAVVEELPEVAIPEPGMTALMLLGGGVLLLRLRWRMRGWEGQAAPSQAKFISGQPGTLPAGDWLKTLMEIVPLFVKK